jgi:hypothetical protein
MTTTTPRRWTNVLRRRNENSGQSPQACKPLEHPPRRFLRGSRWGEHILLDFLGGRTHSPHPPCRAYYGEPRGRIAEPEGSAVINWLLKGSQQNHYVSRKGLGALTKTNPVPHPEFYYFGFQNNSQKHNFVVARLCEPMRFEIPRCASNYHNN